MIATAEQMRAACLTAAGGDLVEALRIACEAAVKVAQQVSAGYVRAAPPPAE